MTNFRMSVDIAVNWFMEIMLMKLLLEHMKVASIGCRDVVASIGCRDVVVSVGCRDISELCQTSIIGLSCDDS